MYQAYMYNGAIWILQSVDPSTRKFVLQLLGGNKVVTVDPSEVKLVDVQQFSEQLQLQVEKHTELLAIDTDKVSDKRKEKARERFDAITLEVSGEIDAVKAAAKCKLSLSQYYKVKQAYDPAVGVPSLLGQARGRPEGAKVILPEVEQIIRDQIVVWYVGENPSKRNVWKGAQAECDKRHLPVPAYETVCDRIDEYSNYALALSSRGKDYASDHYQLRTGTRALLRPLEQAQMDHTLADCFLCANDDRNKVVGRPWFTLIVCSNTKVIVGFCVSFRYPSLGTVAIALKHAVTSKEEFMKKLGLEDHEYPYRGVMIELFMDNAREFRSKNLYSACVLENIKVRYRREKQEGGICERLFGTLNLGTIRVLPGGTGARPRKDRDYDPAKHALLTLDEFIRELTLGICEYHDTVGGDDHKSPRQRWNEYFTGENGQPIAPAPIHNLKKFIIEILPEVTRRVQSYGVPVNTIFYHTPLLKDLVGKKVRVKYDNANLSRVVIWIDGDWVEAAARGNPPETLTELHINNRFRAKHGELGKQGLAARIKRTESLKALKERVLLKSREMIAYELDSDVPAIPRTSSPAPLREIIAERRDFTRSINPYPGEEQ